MAFETDCKKNNNEKRIATLWQKENKNKFCSKTSKEDCQNELNRPPQKNYALHLNKNKKKNNSLHSMTCGSAPLLAGKKKKKETVKFFPFL